MRNNKGVPSLTIPAVRERDSAQEGGTRPSIERFRRESICAGFGNHHRVEEARTAEDQKIERGFVPQNWGKKSTEGAICTRWGKRLAGERSP